MQLLYPAHREIPATTAGRRALLDELYAPEAVPFVRINAILSLNGSFTGDDGTSNSLSNPNDRAILAAIRRPADVVLIGARTARVERYSASDAVALAIASRSGDIRGVSMRLGQRILVLTPPSVVVAADRGVEFEQVEIEESSAHSVAGMIGALHDRGLTRIVCEGGAQLASELFDAGVVADACFSQANVLAAEPTTRLTPTTTRRATLASLIVDEEYDCLYARWRFGAPASNS